MFFFQSQSRCRISLSNKRIGQLQGEFAYAVTAAESIILSSLFIGRKQR